MKPITTTRFATRAAAEHAAARIRAAGKLIVAVMPRGRGYIVAISL